jgi:hypothetical protein
LWRAIKEMQAMSERMLAAEPAFRDEDETASGEAIAWLGFDDAGGDGGDREDGDGDGLV